MGVLFLVMTRLGGRWVCARPTGIRKPSSTALKLDAAVLAEHVHQDAELTRVMHASLGGVVKYANRHVLDLGEQPGSRWARFSNCLELGTLGT